MPLSGLASQGGALSRARVEAQSSARSAVCDAISTLLDCCKHEESERFDETTAAHNLRKLQALMKDGRGEIAPAVLLIIVLGSPGKLRQLGGKPTSHFIALSLAYSGAALEAAGLLKDGTSMCVGSALRFCWLGDWLGEWAGGWLGGRKGGREGMDGRTEGSVAGALADRLSRGGQSG